jgi:hypothetical protein
MRFSFVVECDEISNLKLVDDIIKIIGLLELNVFYDDELIENKNFVC